MSGGTHHVHTRLPSGQLVCADYREHIVPAMRRTNDLMVVQHKEPRPSDLAAILAWYAENAIMSENCRLGLCENHSVD